VTAPMLKAANRYQHYAEELDTKIAFGKAFQNAFPNGMH
jgi:hypothetical protein